MKKNIAFFWILVYPFFAFAQMHNGKISDQLLSRMISEPSTYQDIIIELEDHVDARALLLQFETEQTPLSVRSFQVITQLEAKAQATQPAILDRIRALDGIEKGSAETLWIINAIRVKATAAAIYQMADWKEAGEIGWNFPIEVEYGTNIQPATSSPNGSEPGLRAIKAPFMWKKGYTGYGRKGLIIDTGQDGNHQALAGNFWGNQVAKNQAWNGSGLPEDCADHGTHVAGTICGIDRKTNDTIGVAYNAHWLGGPMNFPVNPDGTGCETSLTQTIFTNIQSMQWAINPDGNANTITDQPDIINNSWRAGNVDCNITLAVNTMNAVEAAGIAIVFAAGNSGPSPSTVSSGSSMNMDLVNSFAVGAVDGANPNFLIADFSSRGPSTCGGTGSLLIKPEVAAPGVNVRSSFNGGIYSSINGTSMAAPHASGAIILLKEAFPALSGTQLKLALYNSATDLGMPGEDNEYGMGMINLESAFNKLVSEGNTPATPVSTAREVILANAKLNGLCNGPVDLSAEVENGGTTNITSLTFSYGLETGTQQTYEWTGVLAPNTYTEIVLPPVPGINPGTYTMVINITKVDGLADTRPLNNRFKKVFTMTNDQFATAQVNTLQTAPFCANSRVLLTYNTGLETNETPQWFANPTGGNPLSTSKTFLTPALTQNTTYYVSAVSNYKVGKTEIAGTSISNSKEGALEFNATRTFKLNSVKVSADEIGSRIIELINSSGTTITTKIISIQQIGEQRINLNLTIPVGSGYELRLSGGKELKQSAGSAGYPHNISGIVSIVRGITPTGGNTNLNYYYFYDWDIELPLVCGRTPVPLTISNNQQAPAVSFSANPNTVVLSNSGVVNFTDLTTDAAARYWDFGNQQTSNAAQPSTTYTAEGNYTVYLVVTTLSGCSNVAEKTITVAATSAADEPSQVIEKAVLYPNPATNTVNLAFLEQFAPKTADIQVIDILGKVIQNHQNTIQNGIVLLDISRLSNGVYFIQVNDNGNLLWTGKLLKQ